MDSKTTFPLLIALTLLGGCASIEGSSDNSRQATDQHSDESVAAKGAVATARENALATEARSAPELIARLPDTLESFDYTGYRYFQESEAGFTVRYQNARKKRSADVYVYPVAQENLTMEHSQLVMGSTRATLQAIGKAVSQGLYANFNVVGAATHARGTRTVARVQTTYLRDNLASYSLLYQTEYEGTLVKIRINMPDNEYNRASAEWDRFAQQVLDLVIGKERPEVHAASGSA